MMIGARGGGGGDPRLEIFAAEAKEFFSSVRAILGEGDADEARSAKINVLLEGFLKSSPRVADLVGDALPLEDSGAPEPEGLVPQICAHLSAFPFIQVREYTQAECGFYRDGKGSGQPGFVMACPHTEFTQVSNGCNKCNRS